MQIKNMNSVRATYAKVNRISVKKASTPEHEKRILSALEQVWLKKTPFEGESLDDVDDRLDIRGPESGEVSRLVAHFKSVRPDEFLGKQPWEVIFILQNELGEHETAEFVEKETLNEASISEEKERDEKLESSLKSKETEAREQYQENIASQQEDFVAEVDAKESDTEVKGMKEVSEDVVDAKDTSSYKNHNIFKEEQKMSNVLDMENEVKTAEQLLGVNGGEVLPEGANAKIRKDAAEKFYQETINEREVTTRKSRAKSVLYAKQPAVEIYVDGENAVGVIENPDKEYDRFKSVTGMVEDPNTGEVTFENVARENWADAKQLLDDIKAAQADPSVTFAVNVSKTSGALMGANYVDPDGKAEWLDKDELVELMMRSTLGQIFVDKNNNVLFQISDARRKNTTKEGKGAGTAKSKSGSNYAGIVTVKLFGRDKALEGGYVTYYKQADTGKIEEKRGPKSAHKVVFTKPGEFVKSGKNQGKPKTGTYRLSLKVKQHPLVVNNDELLAKWPALSGNAATTPINIDDFNDLQRLSAAMIDIVSAVVGAGLASEDNGLSVVKETVAAQEAAVKEAEAKELGDIDM